ncbi:MAG: PhzF family phenazine biosynthesis protein [Pseudomonadota bacterium]|nr:PhzF family phenazine biosynthesis protein [Pseudomonadota bacterium]
MPRHPFLQLDVFSAAPFRGNPLAVIAGADALPVETMQRIAAWTNLSETAFLMAPEPGGDYRVRIFTPTRELPFAGHPTLGACAAWLALGGTPSGAEVAQDCGAGRVRIRREAGRLAFAAPPLSRDGPLEEAEIARIAAGLGVPRDAILAARHADNGPGWRAVLLDRRDRLLAIRPDYAALSDLKLGLVARCDPARDDAEADFELRALICDRAAEDPVTGSLNAAVAQWLIGAGLAPATYLAAQGTGMGRAGRVHVTAEAGTVWIGGETAVAIRGEIDIP